MSPRVYWPLFLWCCGYLLCAGCRHEYRKSENRYLEASENIKWETEASAVEKQQSVETKKTATKRVIEKFRPDGSLMERMTEQHDSDGKVVTAVDSASHSTAAGGRSRSVVAESASSTATSTRAGLGWLTWAVLAVVIAGGCFIAWRVRGRLATFFGW